MLRKTLEHISAARSRNDAIVRAVRLHDGFERLFDPAAESEDELAKFARKAANEDRSQAADISAETWFFHVFNPPLSLLVIGAVHIAQSLVRIAGELAWNVTIIDPRTGFASEERFPGMKVLTGWPDEAMAKLRVGRRSAVVTLTHDPKLDDPALIAALKSDCFYIGALGSRKTHNARVERLKTAGFSETAIARIAAPVGLDIGAQSPSEIAISIAAQIIAAIRGAPRS
jgi:xanthine dehydrogenase accessory factor